MNRFNIVGVYLFVLIINGCGESYNMSTKPLSGEWLKVFRLETDELKAYLETHPIKLKNIIIKHESISKTKFTGAEFINTEWNDSFIQKATITNAIFKGGDIYDTSFADSTLTNVVFENMTMEKAEFVNAILVNVTFKNCKIYNSNFGSLKMSKVLIENSEMNNVEFYESEVDITLKKVNFKKQARFMGLKAGSKVLIEDSFIGSNSTFDHSNILSFTMRNSTVMDSKMNNATVDEIIIEDTKMDFPIANGTLNKITMRNVNSVILGESKINTLIVEDCKENSDILLFETIFNFLSIRNCPIDRITFRSAKGEKISLNNIQIRKAEFGKLIVKELTMNDITINGKADFNGALAEESLVTNFHIKQGTKVSMDGTNIKFQ